VAVGACCEQRVAFGRFAIVECERDRFGGGAFIELPRAPHAVLRLKNLSESERGTREGRERDERGTREGREDEMGERDERGRGDERTRGREDERTRGREDEDEKTKKKTRDMLEKGIYPHAIISPRIACIHTLHA
jgi:hypothetical protein